MKAILISIKPHYCELIAAGKKTIEVRKTKPNIQTPFKVYIYCTKQKQRFSIGKHTYAFADNLYLVDNQVKFGDGFEDITSNITVLNGTVIGEYICTEIEELRFDALDQACIMREVYGHSLDEEFKKGTCVSYKEAHDYCSNLTWNEKNTDVFYGWHISNLIIYDQPKKLSEFRTIDKEYLTKCPYRSRIYNNPDYTNGALLKGSYVCVDDGEPDFCKGQCEGAKKPLTRPPQSWCYVEEINV